MSARSSPGLDAGEDVVLCVAEERWEKTVTRIRFGLEPLCLALQNFLLFLGRLMEEAGEASKIDQILAVVGRAKLPDKKGLTELESQSLKMIELKWAEMTVETRAGALQLSSASEEFLMYVGKYLVSRAEPKSSEKSWAEKQRDTMLDFYHSRKVDDIHIAAALQIPVPSCTDDRLREWFALGENLIYEPSEDEVPVWKLMASLPHRMLADDPAKIVWKPVREGRWLLVDAQEHCPKVGDRSFRGHNMALKEGQRILTLPQYAILWHIGGLGGEILDLKTDTMFATQYGADNIVHAYGSHALSNLQFSVGEWGRTTTKHPKMGVRIARIIE